MWYCIYTKKGYTDNISSLLLSVKGFGYHGTFEESDAIATFMEET